MIDEIWTWESVNHGDACLINQSALSCLCKFRACLYHCELFFLMTSIVSMVDDWTDGSRDTLNFLIHYIPSDAITSPLPTHLDRVPCEESEYRKRRGFRNRILVAVGHSLGGCTSYVSMQWRKISVLSHVKSFSALAALTHPQLFSSLVLIDPIIVQPMDGSNTTFHEEHWQLTFGALMRRETWDSRLVYCCYMSFG